MTNLELTDQEIEVIHDAMRDLLTIEWLDKKTTMIANHIIDKIIDKIIIATYDDKIISNQESETHEQGYQPEKN